MTRRIKMRLMRFLTRQSGWSSSHPWRADGEEKCSLESKAEYDMSRDDERNWTRAAVTKIMACKR